MVCVSALPLRGRWRRTLRVRPARRMDNCPCFCSTFQSKVAFWADRGAMVFCVYECLRLRYQCVFVSVARVVTKRNTAYSCPTCLGTLNNFVLYPGWLAAFADCRFRTRDPAKEVGTARTRLRSGLWGRPVLSATRMCTWPRSMWS